MDVVSVDSVLDAVTVHARGAVCVRLATLPKRERRLPFEVRGLPLSLDAGSLRARVLEGAPSLRVTEVRAGFQVTLAEQLDVAAEQKALEAATERLDALRAELELLTKELTRLQQLRPVPLEREKGQLPTPLRPEPLLAFAELVEGETASVLRRRTELRELMRDAENDVQLRQRRLQEASSALHTSRTRVTRTAVVSFADGVDPSGARIAIEYVVRGARWTPAYELALEKGLRGGTLKLRAQVVQRTGEDWGQVKLALSTADLDRRAEVPELKSLRIGRQQHAPPRSGWREPPEGLDELFGPYDSALASLRPPSPVPQGMAAPAPEDVAEGAPASTTTTRAGTLKKRSASDRHITAEVPLSAPPPPPMAAPAPKGFASAAPPGAAAAPLPSRTSGRMQASRARGAPPPGMPMAKPIPQSARASFDEAPMEDDEAEELAADDELVAGGGGAFGQRAAADAENPLEPEANLLDFGNLELPALDQTGRGRLQPRRGGLIAVAIAQASVTVDVTTLVAIAQQDDVALDSLPLPAHATPVRQAAGAFDHRYDAEHRLDVPSDGRWHLVPIATAPVALEAEYVTVPSEEPRVFRTVKLENRSPHALLPGPTDVLLGGGYLMTVPFPLIPPMGHGRIGLGVEESIKVARNTVFDEAAGGLLSGSSVLTHEIRIEVANRLAVPARIEVRERVPVTTEKDVKIDETQVTPRWFTDKEPRDGVVNEGARFWRFDLAAGATQQLVARYEIRIPSSKMLVGGNRRV